MTNVPRFVALVARNGQDVVYHREEGGTNCPCRTPEGYRDPVWHETHLAPVCNEKGKLNVTVTNAIVKAFVQPAQSSHGTRLSEEYRRMMFGQVESDDHLGIFPLEWAGIVFNFFDWSEAAEDYIGFDGRRFQVVAANKIPDPDYGGFHHWELALRLMKTSRPA